MRSKRLVAFIVGAAIAGTGVLTSASPASALSSLEMTQACKLQHGQEGWTAHLYYPNQGVYGWRCYYNNAPWAVSLNERRNLSVQNWCSRIYAQNAYFRNQSDAYSWYCA